MAEIPYKKIYTMRAVGEGGLNTAVTIPPEVIRREAEKRGLTIVEFRGKFIAVAQYDRIEGVLYTFEVKPREIERAIGDEKPSGVERANNQEKPIQ